VAHQQSSALVGHSLPSSKLGEAFAYLLTQCIEVDRQAMTFEAAAGVEPCPRVLKDFA
jgi:hypothetical protein